MSKTDLSARELRWHQMLVLALLAGAVALWGRTLRFHWGAEVEAIMARGFPPCVTILWHNRLFPSPEFFRRYFSKRKLATLISASGDGAWLAGFLSMMGMHPIRGSRYKRAAQSVREMLEAQRAGFDIGVTPDGSRGPMYDMKAGAVAVALKTGAPLVLLSFNFSSAKQLNSWDRFYLPLPFSRVEVRMEYIEKPAELGDDAKAVAGLLKERLDGMTVDR